MPPPDPSTDFSAFQDNVFSAVMSTVKAASSLASYDLDFERSSDPSFARALDDTNARILRLASSLLKSAAAGSDLAVPSLRTADDVEDRWPEVVEVADNMLERADTCLDEYTGAIKQKHPDLPNARPDTPQRLSKTAQRSKTFSANSWASRNMAKPQLAFAVKPDPFDDSPFKPLLTSKPHAMVPLKESLVLTEMEDGYTGRKYTAYQHPYKTEIETSKYPPALYQKKEPIEYAPLEETQAVWVDTQEKLDQMLAELRTAEEIAVDLEHHDNRSYIGFVCLMQISTRTKDWIVDTLKLRGELQVLNEVFCDPKIIKVLHGAYMDIIWLQRDFGLYIVNLFDTYFAAKTLGFPGHGLAFLLKKYIDFDADKQYQLADWRLRPLPIEMMRYAQSDTHFLLHIFDHLRNALLSYPFPEPGTPDSKLAQVLTGSRDTALRLYTREPYDAENGTGQLGWANILVKQNNHGLNPEQMAVFKALHQWRDTTARAEDEGHHYVLPRHQLFAIARLMPDGAAEVLRVAGHPGDILKRRIDEVVATIRRGHDAPEAVAWREVQAEAAAKAAESAAAAASKASSTDSAAATRRIDIFRITSTPLSDTSSSLLPASTEIQHLRAGASTFWGAAEPQPRFVDPLKNPTDDSGAPSAPSLAIPLPQLTAEVFADPSAAPPQTSQPTPKDAGARAEHEYIRPEARPPKPTEEDVMVIRQVGGGRKRKHDATLTPEETEEAPSTSTTTTAPEPTADDKKLSKAERKAAKKAKKEAAAAAASAGSDQPAFEPFDYASAPSVLHGKKGEDDGGKKGRKERKKKERIFEPFKGVGDAPKAMSRGQKERAGRTGTFKS